MEQVETKVDVLAQLRTTYCSADSYAAIAELIEADKEYDKAYAAAVANPAKEAWLADAEERRAAALARVGGGK